MSWRGTSCRPTGTRRAERSRSWSAPAWRPTHRSWRELRPSGGNDSAGVVLKVLRGLGYIGLMLSLGSVGVRAPRRPARRRPIGSCRRSSLVVAHWSSPRRWRASRPSRPTRGSVGTRSSTRTSERRGSHSPASAQCSRSRRSTGHGSREARRASCSPPSPSGPGWRSPTAVTVRSAGRTGWASPRRSSTWSPRRCGSAGSSASPGAGQRARAERRWVVAARFSTIAMVAAVVVVASGVVQSLRQLDTWSEVTGTDFGKTLIVKVATGRRLARPGDREPAVGVVATRSTGSNGRRRGGGRRC